MAYYDENGRITIDEIAAQHDINRASEAEEILKTVAVQLRRLVLQAEEYEGQTARALAEKAQEMLGRVQKLIDSLEETQTITRQTVSKYKELDARVSALLADSAGKR